MSGLLPYYIYPLDEAGCDEAGRGCLAGPVVAAAVILSSDITITGLNDSKKLSHNQRLKLRVQIIEKATAWAIGMADVHEIDEVNILNASFLAMHRAIDAMPVRPRLLLIDGNRFNPYNGIDHQCVVEGDAKYQSIAAASILAKTERDLIMEGLHSTHPQYNWKQNKGYPTAEHKAAIWDKGISQYHRKSFRMSYQYSLGFDE